MRTRHRLAVAGDAAAPAPAPLVAAAANQDERGQRAHGEKDCLRRLHLGIQLVASGNNSADESIVHGQPECAAARTTPTPVEQTSPACRDASNEPSCGRSRQQRASLVMLELDQFKPATESEALAQSLDDNRQSAPCDLSLARAEPRQRIKKRVKREKPEEVDQSFAREGERLVVFKRDTPDEEAELDHSTTISKTSKTKQATTATNAIDEKRCTNSATCPAADDKDQDAFVRTLATPTPDDDSMATALTTQTTTITLTNLDAPPSRDDGNQQDSDIVGENLRTLTQYDSDGEISSFSNDQDEDETLQDNHPRHHHHHHHHHRPTSLSANDLVKLTDAQLEHVRDLVASIVDGNFNKFMELLEKRGFKSNLLNVFIDGQTALHYSLIYGRGLTWCKQLVLNGANPNLTNRSGWHPIHLAAYSCSKDTMRFLIDCIED